MSILYSLSNSDNICAVSSSTSGNAAIGVIRCSGKKLLPLIPRFFSVSDANKIPPRFAVFGKIIFENRIIDEVIIIYYKSPNSFTGEDMIEIFCHGNLIIIDRIIDVLKKNSFRQANPGEFSFRAFKNKKINLIQAEAVNELISASNSFTIQNSLNVLNKKSFELLDDLKNSILEIKTYFESRIDFSDQNIDSEINIGNLIDKFKKKLERIIDNFDFYGRNKDSFNIQIAGKPNVGKSSIFNLLLNKDRAIVTDMPGATRDIISDNLYINHLIKFQISDAAGIRKTKNKIENIGIKKAVENIENANLILFVTDINSIDESDFYILENIIKNKNYVLLLNKSDINDKIEKNILKTLIKKNCAFRLKVSALTGLNKNKLTVFLKNYYTDFYDDFQNKEGLLFNSRQIDIIKKILESLKNAEKKMENYPEEILSKIFEDMFQLLFNITGEISAEEVLSSIFSKFCIGK